MGQGDSPAWVLGCSGDRLWGRVLQGTQTQAVGLSRPPEPPSPGPYRTRPLVFLRTEAAKLCVTPTRLVPSTSTIRSFTWILGTRGPSQRGHPSPTSPTPPVLRNIWHICRLPHRLLHHHPSPRACGSGDPGGCFRPGSPYLPSRWAAPPSVTVLTKMPSFSRPMSAPAPMPMMLIPSPSESAETESRVLGRVAAATQRRWSHLQPVPKVPRGPRAAGRGEDPPFSSSTGKRSSRSTLFSSSYSADAAMGSTSSLRRS